ncbi:MAG: glycosyl transferase family protein [Novosphingobium sp.]
MDLLSAIDAFAPSSANVFGLLRSVEHELMLFAAFWFMLGIADEVAIDLVWLWQRLVKKRRTHTLVPDVENRPLLGRAAVFIPAWQEAEVIGATIRHALEAWPHAKLRIYIGCYANDPDTIMAAMAAIQNDQRVRLILLDQDGPTTKADCLNRLYRALCDDERRSGVTFRSVILHDAEDMVHPAALTVMDTALSDSSFVQLPVRPEPLAGGRWISGHYIDEFAEAHGKAMVVRDALGAALPSAGVGCALRREVLDQLLLARGPGAAGPFEAECLTEDYELGLLIARRGGQSRFLRLRDAKGELVATRSYFPATLPEAVRQKTRWVHGIAFQGWERLGWWGKPVDVWMSLRDRRGPLAALLLAIAYFLLILSPVLALAHHAGLADPRPASTAMAVMVWVCLAGLVWRMVMRFAFTAREYGFVEGFRAVLRIPVANVIAIMAGRRAFAAYLRSLAGEVPVWEKTRHSTHPVLVREARQ